MADTMPPAEAEVTPPRRKVKRPAHIYPLHELPQDMQDRIAEAVARPVPPPRWIRVVGGQLPSRAWYEWHWQRGLTPGTNRDPLPAGTRRAVIQRDGLVCGLCGGDVEPDDVHIDHILPVSKGGSDAIGNLQVAHSLCNIKKGARV